MYSLFYCDNCNVKFEKFGYVYETECPLCGTILKVAVLPDNFEEDNGGC